ncbi:MAG: DUF1365 domain-containing protein [Alphaproteobacteria bacterium]|nr:DUF1365 domain-containing protein [Alphaproteobacteria bacterium]
MIQSCFYVGQVAHVRTRPVEHRFSYRVFSLYVDVDSLPKLGARGRWFGYNRNALLSVHDRDHGDGRMPIAQWVRHHLRNAGYAADGPIGMQCYGRLWGYVFNPLTVYFCFRADGRLEALLHEVHNTFGERHGYLIAADDPAQAIIRQRCAKTFYVSPFIDMEPSYEFKVRVPAERFALVIREWDRAGDLLYATFHGERRPWSASAAWRLIAGHPLMTLKVVAGIHWEALRLWRKGLRLMPHPATTEVVVDYVGRATAPLGPESRRGVESSVLLPSG